MSLVEKLDRTSWILRDSSVPGIGAWFFHGIHCRKMDPCPDVIGGPADACTCLRAELGDIIPDKLGFGPTAIDVVEYRESHAPTAVVMTVRFRQGNGPLEFYAVMTPKTRDWSREIHQQRLVDALLERLK